MFLVKIHRGTYLVFREVFMSGGVSGTLGDEVLLSPSISFILCSAFAICSFVVWTMNV